MEMMKPTVKAKTIGNLERKPSIKIRTAPPVRQTLTSYKRMLNANPLLKYKEAGIDIDEYIASTSNSCIITKTSMTNDLKTGSSIESKPAWEFKKPDKKPLVRSQSLKVSKTSTLNNGTKTTIISGNRPWTNKYLKKTSSTSTVNSCKQPKVDFNPTNSRVMSSTILETKKYTIGEKSKLESKADKVASTNPSSQSNLSWKDKNPMKNTQSISKKGPTTLRRSLSSGHLQNKKSGKSFDPKLAYSKSSYSTQSEENLSNQVSSTNTPGFSPIVEENSIKSFVFKTPSAYERRSICYFTPRSVKRSSLFGSSTPAVIDSKRLEERLQKWLMSRGKKLSLFNHLRCFGIDHKKDSPQINEENKENIEVLQEKSNSYEDLKIEKESKQPEIILPDIEDIEKLAKEALIELRKLIQEEYPREQCLGWLELIREKYNKLDEEPEYWECRAAIEQSVGNIGNAVEFYKTAIIQGAEVNTVDKSLDQLLKKFSLLNITPSKPEQKMVDRDKERIVRDARNIFKSSIIQFAIQERKLKKKDNGEDSKAQKKLVARPVRRSTRLSRSGYTLTPGVKLCMSLKEIDISAEEYDFEKNTALC